MKALVTGGGGFLGQVLSKRLLELGFEVKVFNRRSYPQLGTLGVECVQGDLAEFSDVDQAMKGVDVCFHVAAKAGFWGSYESYYRPNVLGTRNVIRACRENGVKKLIYTSSPSVVYDMQDQAGIDESYPYPDRFYSNYPRTKAEAEKEVLAADSVELRTVSLRPHLIWGPGDNHLLPRMVEKAKAGRLRFVGSSPKLVDAVYVDNAAEAHLLALKHIDDDGVHGESFFISNDEPIESETLINSMIGSVGIPPNEKRIGTGLAYVMATILEYVYGVFKIKSEPPVTRFVVRQFSTEHWFNIEKSKTRLHYSPKISMKEGLSRLRAHQSSEE